MNRYYIFEIHPSGKKIPIEGRIFESFKKAEEWVRAYGGSGVQYEIIPNLNITMTSTNPDFQNRLADIATALSCSVGELINICAFVENEGFLHSAEFAKLTTLGLPIASELAASRLCPVSEINALITNRVISFQDLVGAIERMTNPNGLLFNGNNK